MMGCMIFGEARKEIEARIVRKTTERSFGGRKLDGRTGTMSGDPE